MSTLLQIYEEMGFDSGKAQLPDAVIYAIARTYSLISRELSAVYHRFGLSAPSFNLLMLLKHGRDPETFTQQEIGRRLVVSASDMTGLIDRLEHKGCVRRNPGRDRRSNLLAITPKGSRLLDEVWPHHVDALKRCAAHVEPKAAGSLLQALLQMRVNVSG